MFLDNESNIESIRLQLQIWLATARNRGSAIAIGHPYSTTLEVLREALPEVAAEFDFMRISRLIEERKLRGFSEDWRDLQAVAQ